MTPDAKQLAEFRSKVTRLLRDRANDWEASRRLIDINQFSNTLRRLFSEASRSDLPPMVRNTLGTALRNGEAERMQDLPGASLKELTGLPPSKAVRALCVWFDLVERPASRWPIPNLDSESVKMFLRDHENPFDLLLSCDVASVLDLGAGDLSFAAELADMYVSKLQQGGRTLIVHAIDRLHPKSKLGGPLHPDVELIQSLRTRPGLSFQFFGDQNMCALQSMGENGRIAPRYTIATCWAPATPTFAFEPTRLSLHVIQEELRRTKGVFQQTQYAGEPALEVQHGDRALLFPPWKFDVQGPLALLDVLSQRGRLCVLGAVDTQVFWELLAQLLEGDNYRPPNQPFSPENIPAIFGDVYRRLSNLRIGETIDLSVCGNIRREIPRVLMQGPTQDPFYGLCSVYIRRGAVFPNIPASSTARSFSNMVEEPPPWMVILVPSV